MLKINLLPTEYKKEFKLHVLSRYILVVAGFLLTMMLFLIILLGIIVGVLKFTQSKIKQGNALFEQARELETQVTSLNQELSTSINERLKYLSKLKKEQMKWSWFLAKLAQILPQNAYLYSLETNEKIKIAGRAKTREDVLLLQKILEKEPQFIEIDSPLSNFIKQKDVDFYFSFKIKNAN